MKRYLVNISTLVRKELKQVIRNKTLLSTLVFYLLFTTFLLPRVINFDLRNLKVTVVDKNQSVLTEKIIRDIGNSGKMELIGSYGTYEDALKIVEYGKADCIVVLPDDLEKNYLSGNYDKIQLTVKAVNMAKAQIGQHMVEAVIMSSVLEYFQSQGVTLDSGTAVISECNLFNPTMDYILFIVPVLLLIMGCYLGLSMTKNTMASEVRSGFMNLINVSPLKPWTLILSKIVSCCIVGSVMFALTLVLSYLFYGLPSQWSMIGGIFLCFIIFLIAISSLAIFIRNILHNTILALLIPTIISAILYLFSGLFTPPESMSESLQYVNYINPGRYLVIILRGIVLKGAEIRDLAVQFSLLGLVAAVMCVLAIVSFRKRLA